MNPCGFKLVRDGLVGTNNPALSHFEPFFDDDYNDNYDDKDHDDDHDDCSDNDNK